MDKKFFTNVILVPVINTMFFVLMLLSVIYITRPAPQLVQESPSPKVEKVEPLTDWKKFYEAAKKDSMNELILAVRLSSDKGHNHFTMFLVDGDKWYYIHDNTLFSCGGPQETYGMFVDLHNLHKHLEAVPSDKAKFVVVGPGRPKLMEVKVIYPKERTKNE